MNIEEEFDKIIRTEFEKPLWWVFLNARLKRYAEIWKYSTRKTLRTIKEIFKMYKDLKEEGEIYYEISILLAILGEFDKIRR